MRVVCLVVMLMMMMGRTVSAQAAGAGVSGNGSALASLFKQMWEDRLKREPERCFDAGGSALWGPGEGSFVERV